MIAFFIMFECIVQHLKSGMTVINTDHMAKVCFFIRHGPMTGFALTKSL